jgi:Tfp pilus assembly protein PilO
MNNAKAQRIAQPIQFALAGLGIVVLALAGWFLLVRPKRADAARYEAQIADVRKEIEDRRAASKARQVRAAVKTADLFRLAKAMPAEEDMAAIILELNEVATDAGIMFESITPQPALGGDGFRALPITLVFRGNFYTLSDFLFRLRQLVQVRDGELKATGQLFSVDTLSFTEDTEQKFPFIRAELIVNAFVFGGMPLPPGTAPAPGASTETSTTSTTETTTTSTDNTSTTPAPSGDTPDSSGADAAPTTPSSDGQ